MSLDLLRLLSDKESHDKYKDLIKSHVLTKEVATIVSDMSQYYAAHTEVDWTDFANWFSVIKHPMYKEEKQAIFTKIFDRLITEEPNTVATTELLETLIIRDCATKVSYIAESIAEGRQDHDLSDLQELLTEADKSFEEVTHDVDSALVTDVIEEIVEHIEGKGGLDWRLDALNLSLGPLRKGDFITVAKRPDAGGTSLLASECTFMAPQLPADEYVLWFNNEESGKKVKFRIMQSALGVTKLKFLSDTRKHFAEYEGIIGGSTQKIKVFNNMHHVKDIERRLREHKAGLIIIDQLWNLHGFEKTSSNEVTRQGMLFRQAREWAGEHAPVLNIHQADGTAEGQQWINMAQMYGSKTAIQAHVDALICIGRSIDPGHELSRFINIPKNKLTGGPKSDESLRNGKFEVIIEPQIARFRD